MNAAPSSERQPSSVGEGTTVKVATVPCRNVVSVLNEACPNWSCASRSFDCTRCSQAPASTWLRPCDR